MAVSSPHASVSVLHVEDDKTLSESVAMLLGTAGYVSEVCGSGEEAMAWIDRRTRDPDVLLVDFELPGDLHGGDVAQEIFRLLGRPIPTIMLSGRLTEATLPWMPGAPLLYVWKPVDPDILLKAIEVFAIFGGYVQACSRRSGEQDR